MKRLLFFVLFLLSFAAQAAGTTCLPSNAGLVSLAGKGSAVKFVKTDAGTGFVYRCPDAGVTWYAVLNSYQGPSPLALAAEALTYPDYTTAAASMWAKYDQPVSGPAWDDLVAKTKAAGFAIPMVVAKNGTYTTRQSFLVTNGVRAASSKTTIPVGSPCDCGRGQFTISGSLYCYVATSYVAICALK